MSDADVPMQTANQTDNMNPETFVAPDRQATPTVTIEFCDQCRWLHRATWTATELVLTFPPPKLAAIHLVPLVSDDTVGRFRVWVHVSDNPPILLWDRKVQGGFPELKDLKQRIRDQIQPGMSLGHSDKKSTNMS